MVPCCENCYTQYLDEDKVIDMIVYTRLKLYRKKQGKDTLDPDDICRCDCHIKNSTFLH
jgi:hypothetical protein